MFPFAHFGGRARPSTVLNYSAGGTYNVPVPSGATSLEAEAVGRGAKSTNGDTVGDTPGAGGSYAYSGVVDLTGITSIWVGIDGSGGVAITFDASQTSIIARAFGSSGYVPPDVFVWRDAPLPGGFVSTGGSPVGNAGGGAGGPSGPGSGQSSGGSPGGDGGNAGQNGQDYGGGAGTGAGRVGGSPLARLKFNF